LLLLRAGAMGRCQAACLVLISCFLYSVEGQNTTNTTNTTLAPTNTTNTTLTPTNTTPAPTSTTNTTLAPTNTTLTPTNTTQAANVSTTVANATTVSVSTTVKSTAAPATTGSVSTSVKSTTAAPATTGTVSTSVKVIVARLIVKGVDYSALSANWELMINFKALIKSVIIEGRNLPEGSVSIALAAGSVIVTATIHPQPGTENTLLADLGQIAAQAVPKVSALPNIFSVTNGEIGVEVLGVQTLPVAPAAPPTETLHGSMLNPVHAAQVAKPTAAHEIVRLSELLEGASAPWVRTHAWQVAGAVAGAVLVSFATIACLMRGSRHGVEAEQQALFPGEEHEFDGAE